MSVLAWTQIIVALVAVLSLGLSIYNLYLRQKDQRPSLRLESGFGIQPGMQWFSIKATNTGKVPITATEIYLMLGENEQGEEQRLYMPALATGYAGGASLPCRLESGEPGNFYTSLEEVRRGLREAGFTGDTKVTARAKDSLGNTYDTTTTFRLGQNAEN